MRIVRNLSLEIEQSVSMLPDFPRYTETDARRASILLRRYEVDSDDESRNTEKRNRDFVTDDLRRSRDIDYDRYKMMSGLFDSFPPVNRNRGGVNFIGEIRFR